MIAYAAYTTTKRNLAALRRADWRILLSPATGLDAFGLGFALDNGAWSAHSAGEEWRAPPFLAALEALGPGCDFVVAPDIVEGGLASLRRSVDWLPAVLGRAPLALVAVQDGMRPADLAPIVGGRVGIFVGGSTEFKEQTMIEWGRLARERGTWCHVGRVNTRRRIGLCAAAGATSFDGSSATRYAVTLPLLEAARRQADLFRPR